MPSLGDIANQVLNVLNQIQTNTDAEAQSSALIKGDTADIKTKLDTLRNAVQSGFLMTAQGLFAILEQEKTANSLLLEEVEQNKTIICWLANIADLLCRIMRKTNTEIELQTGIRNDVKLLERIAELVHSRESVEIRRLEEVEDKVEACCPPPEVPPEPCYESCITREVPIYKPKGGDWQPPEGKDPTGQTHGPG